MVATGSPWFKLIQSTHYLSNPTFLVYFSPTTLPSPWNVLLSENRTNPRFGSLVHKSFQNKNACSKNWNGDECSKLAVLQICEFDMSIDCALLVISLVLHV